MQKKKEAFDYEALKKKTLGQFRSGKDLFSKGGAFVLLLKDFLEDALQAELEEHLQQEAGLGLQITEKMAIIPSC